MKTIYGYKKILIGRNYFTTEHDYAVSLKKQQFGIATLEIDKKLVLTPDGIFINRKISKKLRAPKAKVISIETMDGKKITSGYSWWQATEYNGKQFRYRTGRNVVCRERFDDNVEYSCGAGIHFFESKKAAMDYDFT